jgi:hypothetical protein
MSDNAAEKPFFEKYLAGESAADAIDDFIDAWHQEPGGREIFEYLGMTQDEYGSWLRDPDALPQIAQARRGKAPAAKVKREA